ncbi:MAG TPA: hypothetical protein VNT20_14620, partial [Flavisolibacter sp.]|nr:hypothetical protein [Flavisolibacter sp.]
KLMEDANRLPIKPEIFIETKQFELYEEESFGLPIVMVKLLFNDVKDDNYPFPFLNAINVGNGVAKKIVMTWEYNSKEVEHAAKSIYNLEAFQNEKNEIRFDFLKPNDHLYLSPPKGYLPCCGSKLNPSLTEAWLYPESYKKPRLLLHVDYSDISGYSNYKRTFEVQVKAITSTVTFRFLLQNEYD